MLYIPETLVFWRVGMSDYQGNECPVCHKRFVAQDDIVVCPDCGTPYHRACWQKVGVCVNADKHASGFSWQPDVSSGCEGDEHVCPNCGTHNPAGAQFCNHCGVPLTSADDAASKAISSSQGPIYARRPDSAAYGDSRSSGPAQKSAPGDAEPDTMGLFRREIGPEDAIDGIKAKDWASYVGNSSLYYLMQFVHLSETKSKISVSFSALLFGPLYFFYRKMWKEGAFFTLLTVLLSVPRMLAVLAAIGSTLVTGMDTSWLYTAMNICDVLNWGQMILRGMFAVYWYKKDCTQQIQSICSRVPEGDQRSDQLVMRGGTSVAAVIVYIVLFFAASFVLGLVANPNMNTVNALMNSLYS
jgi:hypothetical protein